MATVVRREGPFRVLVVDDSRTARDLLRAMIEDDPRLSVCGEAADGRAAVDLALALRPDLVTMDLQMPVMDGMQAIAEIMDSCATRILVVSDLADAAHCMAAIARGALDAIPKPGLDDGPAFAARLRMLAGVAVIRHLRARRDAAPAAGPEAGPQPAWQCPVPTSPATVPVARPIVAIATSTGGPQALSRLLPALPKGLKAPVLIAQHIADGFAAGMAQWLADLCPLPVALGRDGESLEAGRIYLADPGTHMTMTPEGTIRLCPRTDRDIYRPSCDRLLCSVAESAGRRAIGVILTGMGRDGAKGISAIAAAGGIAIAQDEASSVVFGMNREAIAAGGVQRVLPLDAIAAALTALVGVPACSCRAP
jgi:two-component system, chemotaxis family, protein-glutamate methylesterase/glutaminase